MKERANAMLKIARIIESLSTDAERRAVAVEVWRSFGGPLDDLLRDRERDRKRMQRDEMLNARLRERDGDLCRYCGHEVDWVNRRGARGGVFDQVDPRREDDNNLVVACRSCNTKKGSRTPVEAGMPLLPAMSRTQADLLSGTGGAECPGHTEAKAVERPGQTGLAPPHTPPTPIVFAVPESIRTALSKCAFLGKLAVLRKPAFWQAAIRAYPGLDYAQVVLAAEAYVQTKPSARPRKRFGQFMLRQIERAAERVE